MTYDNIPDELKGLNQWMVTRAGSKKPLSPHDLTADTWNDPACWGTFPQAVSAVVFGYAEHIGLVLRKENGIVAIDLDNKPDRPATEQQLLYHDDVLKAFGQSYTERSVSNSEENPCFHIFVKGVIPRSVNKEKIELRCDNFIVVTGDVDGDTPKPLLNGAEITKRLEGLAKFLGAYEQPELLIADKPQLIGDDEVYDKMRTTKSDKWRALWEEFQIAAGSNEKDMALLGWIYEYTQNRDQIFRVFHMYPYSQRKKGDGSKTVDQRPQYVYDTIDKLLAQRNTPVDQFKFPVIAKKDRPVPTVQRSPAYPITVPPIGMFQGLVEYGLQSAYKPSEIIAIVGALSTVAAIAGGSYVNPTGGGLALQMLLIASTGAGKEVARSMPSSILSRVQIPNVVDMAGFTLVSSQGIHSTLIDMNGTSTILRVPEGIQRLAQLAKSKAAGANNPVDSALYDALLSLFSENKPLGALQRTGHATKDKKLGTVNFPAVSMLFEGVPSMFNKMLNADMLLGGLLPRFFVFEHIGDDPPWNFQANENVHPALIQMMHDLVIASRTARESKQYVQVRATDEAIAALQAFANRTTEEKKARRDSGQPTEELWTRGYEKVPKVASILAVMENMYSPVITLPMLEWAINLEVHSIWTIEHRFVSGDVGDGEDAQLARMREVIFAYKAAANVEELKNAKAKKAAHELGVVSYSYLQNKTQKAFLGDRLGPAVALKRVLDILVNTGELERMSDAEVKDKLLSKGTYYKILEVRE